MIPAEVKDEIIISTNAETIFNHLTQAELIQKWWPKACESDCKANGKLKIVWFNDYILETKFDIFIPNESIAFSFYTEYCSFNISPVDSNNAKLSVIHNNIEIDNDDISGVIHVAQAWASLLTGLKVLIEHNIDVRI